MLTLTHATERDIDLLLVEEFQCSTEFCRWFASELEKQVGGPVRLHAVEVQHSLRRLHNRREIDIMLVAGDGSSRTIVLVENKLDTEEQFQQAESYRAEVLDLVKSGGASYACTVLICPQDYCLTHENFASKFDAVVFYESIRSYFDSRLLTLSGELAQRLAHKRSLVDQAITKARRGYVAVPLVAIEDFNARYVALAKSIAPKLMPGPSMLKAGRPGESKTMIFAPEVLPDWDFLPQMRIVHQLREANANICFYTWGDQFTHLAGTIGRDLSGTPYRLAPTINKRAGGRSGLMLIADSPAVDNLRGFEEQADAIAEGIRVSDGLRDWFWQHSEAIHRWAITREEVTKGPK